MNRQKPNLFRQCAATLSILLLTLSLVHPAWAQPFSPNGRQNHSIIITAGTPIQLTTVAGTYAQEVFIQQAFGDSGTIYVMDMTGFPPKTTPSHTNSLDLTAQLAGATSTAPGQSYSDSCPTKCIDASRIWVDGASNSDVVIASWR